MGKKKKTKKMSKTIKVRLVLEHNDHLLMLLQTNKNGGKFTLIGGTLDNDELPREALIRESKEEAGLTIYSDDLKLIHTLFKRKGRNLRIVLYFKASRWDGPIESREPKKFANVSWMDVHHLPKNTSPTVKHMLKRYRNEESYSELGV